MKIQSKCSTFNAQRSTLKERRSWAALDVERWMLGIGCSAFALAAFALICFLPAQVVAQTESLLLKGATVHTAIGGTITNGIVLIQNGKITVVGDATTRINYAADTQIIDL